MVDIEPNKTKDQAIGLVLFTYAEIKKEDLK